MLINILDILTWLFIAAGVLLGALSVLYFFRKDVKSVVYDMKTLENDSYDPSSNGRMVFASLSDKDVDRGGDTGRVSFLKTRDKEDDIETASLKEFKGDPGEYYRDDITDYLGADQKVTVPRTSDHNEMTEEQIEWLPDDNEEKTEYLGEDPEEKTAYLGGEEKTEYLGNPSEEKTSLLSDRNEEEERTELLSHEDKGEEETTLLTEEEGDIDIDEEVTKYLELGD